MPVYVSNEDYARDGCAPPDEKKERNRIIHEALKAKLSAGTVHVYILAPDGRCIDSQHVATAAKVDQLTAMLERTVEKLKPAAGEALVQPAPPAPPATDEPGSLRLHLTARYMERKGDAYVVPKVELGKTKAIGWGAYPGEDWITLRRDECAKLLGDGAKVGDSWDLNADVAARVLNYFYPPTENNDIRKNRIERLALRATVLSVRDGVARARIDGNLKMRHPFYHKDDDNTVDTAVLGYLEFRPKEKVIESFRLVTDKATYGRRPFAVAVRTAP